MSPNDLLALPLLSADQETALGRMIEAGVAAAAVLAGYPLRVDASSRGVGADRCRRRMGS